MKQLISLRALLTLIFGIGVYLVFVFPEEWGWMLFCAFATLVLIQIILVRGHLKKIDSAEKEGKQTNDFSPPPPPPRQDPQGLDPALFSRFRSQLESATTPSAGAPSTVQSTQKGEPEDDQVLISSAGKNKAVPVASQAPKRLAKNYGPGKPLPSVEPEDGEADLFDDLRSDPPPVIRKNLKTSNDTYTSQATKSTAKKTKAESEAQKEWGKSTPNKAEKAPASKQPELNAEKETKKKTEESQALAEDKKEKELTPSSSRDDPDKKIKKAPVEAENTASPHDEGRVILKMVNDALEQKDLKGAAAGLDQLQSIYKQTAFPADMILAKTRLASLEGQTEKALREFKSYLAREEIEVKGGISLLAQELANVAPVKKSAEFRMGLLHLVLDKFRDAGDHPGMDRLYGELEAVQEKSGDGETLIQLYKNHLEIKRAMGDTEGQKQLIDHIGNRYYKMGNTEEAKKFYEEGLKYMEES